MLVIPSLLGYIPRQQFASIGDLPLESGATIRDAVVGYRTAGRLDAQRSNAVLVTTWYQGTTSRLAWQIGPGKLVDPGKYFVILVDALANGVSSSPSNSRLQPGAAFPAVTIGDMVESQYRLVADALGLTHLHAVVGVSMGGMQVFQWLSAHPDFVDKGVAIVGTPQSQTDDRARWEQGAAWLRTPRTTRVRTALAQLKPRTALNELLVQPEDHIRQGNAIATFDITPAHGGSLERAAAAMRSKLLVASTWADREVNPKPAFEFAALMGADVLELDGRCGHQAPSCDRATLWPAVARFLERNR